MKTTLHAIGLAASFAIAACSREIPATPAPEAASAKPVAPTAPEPTQWPEYFASQIPIGPTARGLARWPVIMSTTPLSRSEIETEGRRFLNALLTRDYAVLKTYEPSEGFLFEGRTLHRRISDFIYVRDPVNDISLAAIAEQGPVGIMLAWQYENDFTVLFYSKRQEARMNDLPFLLDRYLRDYFACHFSIAQGQWKLLYHFCYAETDEFMYEMMSALRSNQNRQ